MTSFKTDYRFTPPKILIHPNDTHATGLYRHDQPAKAMRDAGYATVRIDAHFVSTETLQVMRPDVVVFPTLFSDHGLSELARYAKALPNTFLVYDIGDLLWDVPEHNPAAFALPSDIKRRMQKAVALCHRVTVTTQVLADAVHKELKVPKNKIAVIPNCISRQFLNAARLTCKAKERGAKMRVGWAGGSSHRKDLELLAEVVRATADKYQWVFQGSKPDGVDELIEFHPAVALADYPVALGALDLDVAVAPLEDTRFNACKSDLRILEYAACGYPVIASLVPAFAATDSVTLTVKNTLEEWEQSLNAYESIPKFRECDAQKLNDWLLAKRMQDDAKNIEATLKAWLPKGAKQFWPYSSEFPGTLPSGLELAADGFVYTRPGTVVDAKIKADFNAVASVSVVSNDGFYPVVGQFTDLNDEARNVLPQAFAGLADGEVRIPRPSGPYIFLSERVVSLIGLPDESRYGTFEAALVDWSIRAHVAGFHHVMQVNQYAAASQPPASPEAFAYAQKEVIAWTRPEVFQEIEAIGSGSSEKFAEVFRQADGNAFKVGNIPTGEGKRILLINGDANASVTGDTLKGMGHAVLQASLLGHFLTLDPRFFSHVDSIDLRRDTDDLARIIASCGIADVYLSGLGEGSVDMLGSLVRLKAIGFNVVYIPNSFEFICPRVDMVTDHGPCGLGDLARKPGFNADSFCQACVRRCGSPYGYVNVEAYRTSWRAFMQEIARDDDIAQDADAD